MFEEAISLLSIWASMNSWLTPTVLFLLLNLMIGTIAVTSGFTSHKPSHHHNNHHEQPIFHQIHHQQQPQPQIQSYLSRSPSVLQRLKSINFSAFYSAPPATTHHHQQPDHEPEPKPEQPIPPLSSADDGGDNVGGGGDDAPSMDEIYSRIKQGTSNHNYDRQNSDTKPSGGVMPDKLAKKMKKSATDMSAFNHFHLDERVNNAATLLEDDVDSDVEEREYNAAVATTAAMIKEEREDDGGVDAKADDFINNFRKQLLMQRKDSFLGYKDIITRTSAQ